MTYEVVVLIWLVCAAIGGAIGSQKGMGAQGAILGLVLGVIGVIIIAVIPAKNAAAASPTVIVNQAVPGAPQANVGGAGLADSLRELDALHSDGLLTDDEFRAQKRLLLGFGDGDLPARAANTPAVGIAPNFAPAPPVAPTATPPTSTSPPTGPITGHHFCQDCGTRLTDSVKFCSNCGASQ
jgi:hypothetical protein